MITGITGSIGCGKSTATKHFHKLGFQTATADGFCREFYLSDKADILRKRWGEKVYSSQNVVDYNAIGKIIFESKEDMQIVSNLIYEYVNQQINNFIEGCNANKQHGFIEIPLLFEKEYDKIVDKTLCVWCNENIRHRRLMDFRKLSANEITARESRQMKAEKKLELADIAVINNGTTAELEMQINLMINNIKGN